MLPATDSTVYHGTNLFAAKIIQYNGIWLNVQRQLTDLGMGFYVTLNLYQARSWAQIRATHPQISPKVLERLNISKDQYFNHPDTKIPAYLVYELDLKQLNQLKGKIFPCIS
ncbi:uncharacterized protein DUF3990 [Anoxybacillus vitaminiphilus]|uniref:Uncharacterized protein DUF3990 n=1 Tax=Paranoxybacillus vitaminiphilus TaxID=581036 RepID=A0A327YR80_9BACL|nr:DUF3990 domain-containing protein [Anoxybacillus vitaminiphilus]RAK23463.1 uncharacterized protein DUF3990 [Anoxybacillus vitaminiphilus]